MDLYHEIKVMSHMLKREFEMSEECKTLNLFTSSSGCIIGYLANSKGDVYQKDVEAHFSLRRSTVSKMLLTLEENGYIVRESVECDARLKKITLTEKGFKMHMYVAGAIDRINRQAVSGISPEEMAIFESTLEKIKKNIQNC